MSAEPENISVEVNGVPLELDVAPVIENGRTLVPVRAICEALRVETVTENREPLI